MNNLRNLTINDKTSKMPILHHLSATSQNFGSGAIAFVGSLISLGVTLNVCYNLGFLSFSLPKNQGVDKSSVPTHTCGSDAITFVGSLISIELTLTACHDLGFLRFFLPKIGGLSKYKVQTCKLFQF